MNPSSYVVVLALLNFGCSGREVPSTFPESSPASLSAEEALPMLVTRALDEHPPLPSEETHGWKGLRQAENVGAQEHDHREHAGHAEHAENEAYSSSEKPFVAPQEHEHKSHAGHSEQEAPSQKDGADSYSCPMHPEVTSEKPGRCPRCGMNLEKKR